MRRLAALALLGLLLAASGSLAAPAPDAPTVGAGPANISITIGQTKAFTIARGPPTIFIVDLTSVTNSTFLEVFFQSPQGSKSQCTFTYTVNGQIFTGSFPNVFQLYNYYLRLGQSNNTIIVNETMGLCAASLTVRLSPLIALVPKAGLQAVNVQILVNSYVRFTIGSPGEALAPFALNITGTNAQMSLSGPGNCAFYQPVTGAVPTCVLDANRIPFGQYGGNGLGWTGPWNLTLTLSSSFYPLQFQFINVTYVPEPALPLAIAVQQNISLSSFYSNIFTVPLSRTQGRNITVTALNCMAGFAYSAGNFAIVGSASIGWNYNTYSFSFLLPPSRTATSWVTVIERTDMGSVPCPGTIIVT